MCVVGFIFNQKIQKGFPKSSFGKNTFPETFFENSLGCHLFF